MVINPVEQKGDPLFPCGKKQFSEFALRSEKSVRLQIVSRIVAMIAPRLAHGIQIHVRNAERAKIGKFPFDPFEIAAEEIGIGDFPVFVRQIFRHSAPVPSQAFSRGISEPFRTEKPIGKDLIHHAAPERGRSVVPLFRHKKLIFRRVFRKFGKQPCARADPADVGQKGIEIQTDGKHG